MLRVMFRAHEIRQDSASWRQIDTFGLSPVKGSCPLAPQTDCGDEQALSLCRLLYGSHTGYPYYLYCRQPSILEGEHCERESDLALSP